MLRKLCKKVVYHCVVAASLMASPLILSSHSLAQTSTKNISDARSQASQRHYVALPSHMSVAPTTDESRAPIGWVQFCRDMPSECTLNEKEPEFITLTSQVWRNLQKTNSDVNKAIQPMTDIEHHGVPELWSLPTDGKGDCEDYALLKRKQLAEMGIPRRALLMTVVIDDQGGHAVLTVRTNRGDFILDNKRNAILSWDATGYRFVKREAQHKNANAQAASSQGANAQGGWVALGDPGPAISTAGR